MEREGEGGKEGKEEKKRRGMMIVEKLSSVWCCSVHVSVRVGLLEIWPKKANRLCAQ